MTAHIALLFSLLITASRAEIIDRIAVTLDNQVITLSEITLEIRLTAFLNGDPLDFSQGARQKAANRLIEQKLIRREIQVGRYTAPTPEEVEPMLKEIQGQRFHSTEEYRQALTNYGVSEDELKAHLLWQLTLLRFIDIRFRPGVQVTDAEIQSYFDGNQATLQPQSATSKRLSLDDLRSQIRETLTEQGADKQLDAWLAEARTRTRIEFHKEAFQ
jgi:peptidyl-prolyl cis-trans isomerase SurA